MTNENYIQAVAELRPRIVAWAERALGQCGAWRQAAVADDAEDVAQEVLLRLWMMRGRLTNSEDMERLASVMARNLSLNRLRDDARHRTVSLERSTSGLSQAHSVATAPADTPLLEKENDSRLRRAATAIPDRYRAILHMRNTEGLSYADIARALGTTESSVRGMVSKARAALIQQLKTTRKQ